MPKGIFLTIKDVMKLEGLSVERSAWQTLRTIRDSLGKKEKHEKVTLTEYAKYRGIALEEVKNCLRV